MRSFTSSFRPAGAAFRSSANKLTIAVMLVSIVGWMAAMETFARVAVERRSKLQREINREHAEAAAIHSGWKQGGPGQVLIVGNSLVGQDLDFPAIERGLAPQWRSRRMWIHATGYQDWYYGLKRLFGEGARPDAVVVTMAAMHWHAGGIRGDYAAAYLFQARDIPQIGQEAGLDRTGTSDLLFARISRFYALRSEIRKQVLQVIFPDLPQLYALFKPTASKLLTSQEVLRVIEPRIRRMSALTGSYGARLILVVPPVPRPGQEFHSELRTAAKQAGVDVVMPDSLSDVPANEFEDDVHLTAAGAAEFTRKLIPPLKLALGNPRVRSQEPHLNAQAALR